MHNLTSAERQKYETIWALDTYASLSPGEQLVQMFQDMTGATGGTVLDAGCGSGKGAVALAAQGFKVTLCDLTPTGLQPEAQTLPFFPAVLWDNLQPLATAAGQRYFDYVYCCDVLEHIPPTFTMLVVQRLLDVANKGVFLSISTVPDQFGAWIGTPLHQTVQPFVAWRDQLGALGKIVEGRDLLTSACFMIAPRS